MAEDFKTNNIAVAGSGRVCGDPVMTRSPSNGVVGRGPRPLTSLYENGPLCTRFMYICDLADVFIYDYTLARNLTKMPYIKEQTSSHLPVM